MSKCGTFESLSPLLPLNSDTRQRSGSVDRKPVDRDPVCFFSRASTLLHIIVFRFLLIMLLTCSFDTCSLSCPFPAAIRCGCSQRVIRSFMRIWKHQRQRQRLHLPDYVARARSRRPSAGRPADELHAARLAGVVAGEVERKYKNKKELRGSTTTRIVSEKRQKRQNQQKHSGQQTRLTQRYPLFSCFCRLDQPLHRQRPPMVVVMVELARAWMFTTRVELQTSD